MQPGERITGNYNLDSVAGEAIRQEEANGVISRLDQLFSDASKLPVTSELEGLIHASTSTVRSTVWEDEAEIRYTKPYDTFTPNGITYESRLLQVHMPEHGYLSYEETNIYLISLMANGQLFASTDNCRVGVIVKAGGERAFFKIVDDAETNADKPGTGLMRYDWFKQYRVDILDPEEQYMVVQELNKALEMLS